MKHVVPTSDLEQAAIRVWRGNGRRESTIRVYLMWVHRFERDPCSEGGTALTLARVRDFAARYAENRHVLPGPVCNSACIALKSWSCALHLAGRPVPRWEEPTPSPRLPPLLGEYCEFRRRHAGVAVSTLATEAKLLSRFLGWLRDRGMQPHEIGLPAVDDFITAAGERYCRKTVAGMCSRLRPFLRFMHQQGHIAHDISSSVASPRLRPAERPARALPWGDVQRMIGAIDMSDRTGKRDYALLLMMLTYGMGSAEAIGVTLDDINWRAGSLRVVRPKTGVEFHLPLLPAVAEAVVGYLRGGRPSATGTRAVFVREVAPYGPMTSSAVRQVVRKHAIAAGIEATPLGGHILRHTHASRELELGAPAKVVGDILGHKDPASISHYVRVATDSLRDLSLAVPK